jgi:hypothetical protein
MNSRFFALTLSLLCLPVAGGWVYAQAPAQPLAPAHAASPASPTFSEPQGKVPPPPGQIDVANEPIVKVVANVQPAVININAEETVPEYYMRYDPYFRPYRGVVNHTAQSIGSGLIISADGYILTNAHVVALAAQEKSVNVTLSTGSKYRATIVNEDDDKDLALLKIDDQTAQYPYFDLTYVSPKPRHPQRQGPHLHRRGAYLQQPDPDRCRHQPRQQRRPAGRSQRRPCRHQLGQALGRGSREHRLRHSQLRCGRLGQ